MEKEAIIKRLKAKPDLQLFVTEGLDDENMLPILLDIVKTDNTSVKYTCTKVVRLINEQRPELVYPYFEQVASWLKHPNSFIKWDACRILADLAAVDLENKFARIYQDYFDLIHDPQMITAANVIGNAWKIVQARLEWESDITGRLLEVPGIVYLHEGEPSPECNSIACGHVIKCFDHYFNRSANQAEMLLFAEEQRKSTRKAVSKIAEKFLQRHRNQNCKI